MELMDLITSQLDQDALSQIAGKIGGNSSGTQNAIESAVPLLLAGLGRNAKQGQAGNIQKAIEKDHDGSILDNLSDFLGQGPSQRDNRIADHILGAKRSTVENKVAESSGLSSEGVSQLLATLGPIVMGALSKQQKQSGSGGSDLASMLGSVEQVLGGGAGGNALSGLLDGDGDGDVDVSDLTRLGGGLLGKFLK